MSLRISAVLLISLSCSACGISRATSKNLLERRADYGLKEQLRAAEDSGSKASLSLQRTEPQMADIWIHPHEMPTGDYFRGGWIRSLISDSRWEMTKEMEAIKIP